MILGVVTYVLVVAYTGTATVPTALGVPYDYAPAVTRVLGPTIAMSVYGEELSGALCPDMCDQICHRQWAPQLVRHLHVDPQLFASLGAGTWDQQP